MKEAPQIGHSLKVTVHWYDRVPEPPRNQTYEGEVVGWRDTQVIIRVKDYAVLRFWKRNGLEVGNQSHERRGFRVELSELTQSTDGAKPTGIAVSLDVPDT